MKKNCFLVLLAAILLPLAASAVECGVKLSNYRYVCGSGVTQFTLTLSLTSDTALKGAGVQVTMPPELASVLNFDYAASGISDALKAYATDDFTVADVDASMTFAYNAEFSPDSIPASPEGIDLANYVFTCNKEDVEALVSNSFEIQIVASGFVGIDDSEVAITNGTFSVVKLFNAAAIDQEASDDDSPVTIDFTGAFTDDKGEAVDGTVTELDGTLDPKYGTFALNNGVVTWTKPAVPPNGHANYDAVTEYTATDGTYSDSNVITLTVTPVDNKPVVTLTETTAKEGEPLVVKFTATDADGDEIGLVTSVTLDGTQYAGATVLDEDGYTFTSTNDLSYDTITGSPRPEKKNLTLAFDVTASWEGGSGTTNFEQAIEVTDKDREPSGVIVNVDVAAPKTTDDVTASGSVATPDPDGDAITAFTYSWSNGTATVPAAKLASSSTKKGEEWTVTVGFKTSPYGTEKIGAETNTANVTIANTEPVAAESFQKFIQKTGSEVTGTITITAAADPDVDDGVDTLTYNITSKPDGLTITSVEGNVVSYSIAAETAEFEGEVTYTVSDGDAVVNGTFSVKYAENPAPVISIVSSDIEEGVSYPEAEENVAKVLAISVSAADQTEEGAPAASGVAAITWTLTDPYGTVTKAEEFTPSAGAATAYGSITLTLGYDVLAGADRPASADYTLTVYATDGDGAVSESLTWNFKVADVDRAPTVPTGFTLSAATLKYGETVTASNAAGSEDLDGDAVTYQYTWTLNGADETVNEDGAWPGYTIKRADVVAVTASAKATPNYGSTAMYSDKTAAISITVDNTAPVLVSFADTVDKALTVTEYTDEPINAQFSLSTTSTEAQEGYAAGATDVDGDAITFAFADDTASTVVKDADENEIATVTIEGTTLTITPVQFAVTADTAYSFSMVATDEANGKSEEKVVFFKIPLTNTAPEVTVRNIFASPAKAGTAESTDFPAVLGKSDWENANQAGTAINKVVTDEAGILAGADVTIADFARDDEGNGFVTVTYTLAEDSAQKVGKSATIQFQLQDNGFGADAPAVSELYEFTITVGGTPWWPEIDLGCTEHDYHQVVISPDESADVTLVVKGAAVTAIDYYNASYAGMKDGEAFTWKAYAFDTKDGASETACAEGDDQVEAYTKPEPPVVTLALGEGDNEGTIVATVNAPLAASYELTLYDANDKVVKVVSASFAPGEEGVNSSAEVTFAVDAGTYKAKATATNPEGTSDESDFSNVVEVAEAEPDYKWSDGAFLPNDSFVYVPSGDTQWTVTFSWPSFIGADSYKLVLDFADGKGSKSIEVAGLTHQETFKLTSDSMDISWYVEPVGTGFDSYANASDSYSYQILKSSSTPVLTNMTFNDAGNLELAFSQDASASVSKIEFEVFGVSENDWLLHFLQNDAKIPEFSGDGLTATVDGFSGLTAGNTYYVLYRLFSNDGKAITQFRLWSVTK